MKTTPIFLTFLLCLTVIFSGCDRIYGILQPEGAEELAIIGEIKPYEPHEGVARIQRRLKLFGYAIGTIDGVLGANTRDAIEKFQRDNGIKPSRFIDHETWNALTIYDYYGLIYNEDINAFTVQAALYNANYDVGSRDGKLGPKSIAALKKFQEDEGLIPDGRIGRRTLSALARYLPAPDLEIE